MGSIQFPVYQNLLYCTDLLAEKEKPICMVPVSQMWFGIAYAFQIHSMYTGESYLVSAGLHACIGNLFFPQCQVKIGEELAAVQQ